MIHTCQLLSRPFSLPAADVRCVCSANCPQALLTMDRSSFATDLKLNDESDLNWTTGEFQAGEP
eukprot:38335-Pleurochrysis_carterae.AAC.2